MDMLLPCHVRSFWPPSLLRRGSLCSIHRHPNRSRVPQILDTALHGRVSFRIGDAHAFGPPPRLRPQLPRNALAVQALEEIFTLGTKRPLSPKEMEGGNKPKNAASRAT